jgi:hypothetical protein
VVVCGALTVAVLVPRRAWLLHEWLPAHHASTPAVPRATNRDARRGDPGAVALARRSAVLVELESEAGRGAVVDAATDD